MEHWKVSFRCEDMVAYCEIHKQFLTNYFDAKRPTCCQILFDSEPFFTIKGTCYKTKIKISEHSPFVYSSIKIWMQELKDKTLGKSVATLLRNFLKVINQPFRFGNAFQRVICFRKYRDQLCYKLYWSPCISINDYQSQSQKCLNKQRWFVYFGGKVTHFFVE